MVKQINRYIGKFRKITPTPNTEYKDWSWRLRYVGMEGLLVLLKSEHKHYDEKFLEITSFDGRYLKKLRYG